MATGDLTTLANVKAYLSPPLDDDDRRCAAVAAHHRGESVHPKLAQPHDRVGEL